MFSEINVLKIQYLSINKQKKMIENDGIQYFKKEKTSKIQEYLPMIKGVNQNSMQHLWSWYFSLSKARIDVRCLLRQSHK